MACVSSAGAYTYDAAVASELPASPILRAATIFPIFEPQSLVSDCS